MQRDAAWFPIFLSQDLLKKRSTQGANPQHYYTLVRNYKIVSDQKTNLLGILLGYQYSSSNENGICKLVDVNVVSIREQVKQARDTHRYIFSTQNFTSAFN